MMLKAIRLATELEDVSLIGQAINERRGELGIAKDLGPVGKRQVGSHNDGHLLV